MHPRIRELYTVLKEAGFVNAFDIEALILLKRYGATRTEASITMHLGFKIELEVADEFVIKSNVWGHEDVEDVFYQTLKYLYYSDKPSDYEADDDRVNISI